MAVSICGNNAWKKFTFYVSVSTALFIVLSVLAYVRVEKISVIRVTFS